MKLSKAFSRSLGYLSRPLITNYELAGIMLKLYKDKVFEGEKLNVLRDIPDRPGFNKVIASLESEGIINSDRNHS